MNYSMLLLLCCIALVVVIGRRRAAPTLVSKARRIAFHPTENVTADELFSHLLSANLAVIEGDDFNQLGSALVRARVLALLSNQWNVQGAEDAAWRVDKALRNLESLSAERSMRSEDASDGSDVDQAERFALVTTCRFFMAEAGIETAAMHPTQADARLFALACEIQRVAYLCRLGVSAGFIERWRAQRDLKHLADIAKAHFSSMEHYSLASLFGLGIDARISLMDANDWYSIAESHKVLMAASASTVSHASRWRRQPIANGMHPLQEDLVAASEAA